MMFTMEILVLGGFVALSIILAIQTREAERRLERLQWEHWTQLEQWKVVFREKIVNEQRKRP